MAPKSAQTRVAALQAQGVSLTDARSQLKSEGYSKSRVSQLLKGYAVAAAGVPAVPGSDAAEAAPAADDLGRDMPAGCYSSSESDARIRLPFDGSL